MSPLAGFTGNSLNLTAKYISSTMLQVDALTTTRGRDGGYGDRLLNQVELSNLLFFICIIVVHNSLFLFSFICTRA